MLKLGYERRLAVAGILARQEPMCRFFVEPLPGFLLVTRADGVEQIASLVHYV